MNELAGDNKGKILPSNVARASVDAVYHPVLATISGGLTIDGKNGQNCFLVRGVPGDFSGNPTVADVFGDTITVSRVTPWHDNWRDATHET